VKAWEWRRQVFRARLRDLAAQVAIAALAWAVLLTLLYLVERYGPQ